MYRISFFLGIGLLLLVSCHKDVDEKDGESQSTTVVTTPLVFDETRGDLVGYVFTEDNTPVEGADVRMYSASSVTDKYGSFVLSDVRLDQQGTVVRVSKPGYKSAIDMIYPSESGRASTRIYLHTPQSLETFDNQVGGELILDNDVSLIFPASSVIDSDQQVHDGSVVVDVVYACAADADFDTKVIGGLRGQDERGRTRVLGALASISIDGYDGSGGALQVGNDKKFVVRVPACSNSVAEIGVWRYDHLTDHYSHQGVARVEDGAYVFDAEQLGDYLIADDYGTTQFCGRVVSNTDSPMSNYEFEIRVNNLVCATGYTDSDGLACAKVPQDYDVQFRVLDTNCGTIMHSETIGASDQPIYVADMLVSSSVEMKTGMVFCDSSPISGAVIVVLSDALTYLVPTDDTGTFAVSLPDSECATATALEIFAIYEDGESFRLTLDDASADGIMFDVCKADCDHAVSFDLLRIDYCTDGEYDVARAVVTGGSGDFAYEWDNGGTGSSNAPLSAGMSLCVSVEDLADGCVVEHCEVIPLYSSVSISELRSFNSECEANSGRVILEVEGGVAPYDFSWNDGGGFTSDDKDLDNLLPGMYAVEVRDATGCTVTGTIEVFDVLNALNSEIVEECLSSFIFIIEEPGYGPYQYVWSNDASTENHLEIFEPGEYAVTVSDQNGCIRSKSFELSKVGAGIAFAPLSVCIDRNIEFLSVDPNFEYRAVVPGIVDPIFLDVQGTSISIDIFEVGYEFGVIVIDPESGCSEEFAIAFPHFTGLSIENIVDTSCETCTDGQIIYSIDDTEPCTEGCTVGDVIVIDSASGDDVTDQNDLGVLVSGEYYVVVDNGSGGCFIAHEAVTIE